jgi:hypothetical protein
MHHAVHDTEHELMGNFYSQRKTGKGLLVGKHPRIASSHAPTENLHLSHGGGLIVRTPLKWEMAP